jgi:hypothetical protein
MAPLRFQVIVVGGGAAGLIAAGRAAELGAEVLVLEKMGEAGKKLLVSGKERCNLTNVAPLEDFLHHYGPQGAFLRNAYYRFFREELVALLDRYGVQTHVERGGRIFPMSGQAVDVRDALLRYALGRDPSASGSASPAAEIRYHAPVAALELSPFHKKNEGKAKPKIEGVRLRDGEVIHADTVVLATGGASWTRTGSTGDGYRMAKAVGHTIVPLRPALVPLTVEERAWVKALQGISLYNVACTLLVQDADGSQTSKAIIAPLAPRYPVPPTGELLFTHFGLSGPLILTLSLDAVDALREGKRVYASIDLKPGMTADQIHARLQREFEHHPHQQLPNLLRGWAPRSLAEVIAQRSGIANTRPVHSIRAEERAILVTLFKDFRWHITGSLPLEAGMVTAGGVALDEVDPRTFASQNVAGLFLAGEVLDIAADTGGYNLQAAFSSGYLAGENAAQMNIINSNRGA